MTDPTFVCPTVEVSGPGGRITVNQSDLARYSAEGYKKIPGTERNGPKNGETVSVQTEADSTETKAPPEWTKWERPRLMKAAEGFGIKTKGMPDETIVKALEDAGFDGKE